MKHSVLALSLFALAACATPQAEAQQTATCRPAGFDRARMESLKASEWTIADDATRNRFARELTSCLGDPDETIRDGIAFEALQHYMRNNLLTTETLAALDADLQSKLTAPDPQGFQRPFAALVLADVARTDRISPWMSEAQRAQLINAAVAYMTSITDYRGFTPGEGYRHAPAHTADLMLQLVLNQAVTKPDLIRIRDAIATQIAPDGHFYINGESERLATPILYMAQRNLFSEAEWTAWFTSLAGPGPLGASWDNWFKSETGLSRRHNLMAFLTIMQTNLSLTQNPAFAVQRPGVEAALRAMP
ncbi:MAG: DUF2785 domain-containing protein [Hyphomonadaceae bacterium]|nr:DUF2785 domain-containing protein [Hyphomonadaceae bacterium]